MNETEVVNDTPVFYSLRYDHRQGEMVPADYRLGTRDAIRRSGYSVGEWVGNAPHQWLKDGFVDLELSIENPYSHRAMANNPSRPSAPPPSAPPPQPPPSRPPPPDPSLPFKKSEDPPVRR